MKKSLCFAIVGFVVFVCLSATARVLVYEPFDYPDGWLKRPGWRIRHGGHLDGL